MFGHVGWLVLFVTLLAGFSASLRGVPPQFAEAPAPRHVPPPVERVRQMLSGDHFKDRQRAPLLELGEDIFPAFEIILADPKSNELHVTRILLLLTKMKGNKQRFLDITLDRLNDPIGRIRSDAIALLRQIGSERDTAPLLALLSDEVPSVREEAAEALAATGGRRDVIAMDIWLKSGNYRNDVQHLQHVKECRNALEKRLKSAKEDKK